jgi:hypothetical protein
VSRSIKGRAIAMGDGQHATRGMERGVITRDHALDVGGIAFLTRDEAVALAAELTAQLARTSGTVALARVKGDRIVFDLAEARPNRTPHSLCWSVRTRDEILAHWRGYTGGEP